MTHLSLFSGIGGIDIAAHWAGFTTVGFVEREPFCQKVLAKHWPEVPIFDDIRTFDATQFRGVDLVSGGFPCQDISQAGKQAGLSGERSGLWFEMLRVVAQARPAFVLAENVSALIGMGIDTCLAGLEAKGYTARALVLPASGVGAVHKRERCFIVAHSNDSERKGWNVGDESTRIAHAELTDARNATGYGFNDQELESLSIGHPRKIGTANSRSGDARNADCAGLEGQRPTGATSNDACDPSICGSSGQSRGRAGSLIEDGHFRVASGNLSLIHI